MVYGSRGRVMLEPTAVENDGEIRRAITGSSPRDRPTPRRASSWVTTWPGRRTRPNAINRVILASDGVANVGASGPDSILDSLAKKPATTSSSSPSASAWATSTTC